MANRYGRNQKRKHRERIAELERELLRGLQPAERGDQDIYSLGHVRELEEIYSKTEAQITRSLRVVLMPNNPDQLYNMGWARFSWQGAVFLLERVDLGPSESRMFNEPLILELHFVGLG